MKNTVRSNEAEAEAAELPADIVSEILLRLPIKKVFELTCVDTFWRSLILRPDFLQIYRSRIPNAGLVITVSEEYDSRQIISVYHSILEQHERIHDTPPPPLPEFVNSLNMNDAVRITEAVNGLVCVCFNDSNNLRCLSLNSVRSGEIVMRLPQPVRHRLARYCLGFEPVNGVYKLLKIGKPKEYFFSYLIDSNCYDFEILTLSRKTSDMCWRKLPKSSPPVVFGFRGICPNNHHYLDSQSFSVNGFIFWLFNTELLISFDLREYKFRKIQPPRNFPDIFMCSRFTQFRGRLGLFKGEESGLLPVIYTLNGKEDEDAFWIRNVITLPCEVDRKLQYRVKTCRRVIPVGNLPTGEILIAVLGKDDPFTPIYSYDYKNGGSFKRFVVGKFPEYADKRDDQGNIAAHIRFTFDDGFCCI